MWIRVKGGVSSQLVDESLKKNVVIKNKQAGWAGLLRSRLLEPTSRQVAQPAQPALLYKTTTILRENKA